MDKQRTENMASDDAEKFERDLRSSKISEEDTGLKPTINEVREGELNNNHQEANKCSQKNAEHDAKYGDASDAERSRLPKDQQPEDAHVPQG
jgi:hypothetical protein